MEAATTHMGVHGAWVKGRLTGEAGTDDVRGGRGTEAEGMGVAGVSVAEGERAGPLESDHIIRGEGAAKGAHPRRTWRARMPVRAWA